MKKFNSNFYNVHYQLNQSKLNYFTHEYSKLNNFKYIQQTIAVISTSL